MQPRTESEIKATLPSDEKKHQETVAALEHQIANLREVYLKKQARCGQPKGYTALIAATFHGHTDTALKLIEEKASLDLSDYQGYTALMYAALNGNDAIVTRLIEKRAPLERKAEGIIQPNNSALILAARANHTTIAIKLIEARANCDIVHDGRKALDYALLNENDELVNALRQTHLAATPQPEQKRVEAQSEISTVPKMEQAKNQQSEENNVLDEDGNTELMRMSRSGNVDAVTTLIDKKVSLDIKNANNDTALILASRHGHTDVVSKLIENKASLDHASTHEIRVGKNMGYKDVDCISRDLNIFLGKSPSSNISYFDFFNAMGVKYVIPIGEWPIDFSNEYIQSIMDAKSNLRVLPMDVEDGRSLDLDDVDAKLVYFIIMEHLRDINAMYIHCYAGVGRTGNFWLALYLFYIAAYPNYAEYLFPNHPKTIGNESFDQALEQNRLFRANLVSTSKQGSDAESLNTKLLGFHIERLEKRKRYAEENKFVITWEDCKKTLKGYRERSLENQLDKTIEFIRSTFLMTDFPITIPVWVEIKAYLTDLLSQALSALRMMMTDPKTGIEKSMEWSKKIRGLIKFASILAEENLPHDLKIKELEYFNDTLRHRLMMLEMMIDLEQLKIVENDLRKRLYSSEGPEQKSQNWLDFKVNNARTTYLLFYLNAYAGYIVDQDTLSVDSGIDYFAADNKNVKLLKVLLSKYSPDTTTYSQPHLESLESKESPYDDDVYWSLDEIILTFGRQAIDKMGQIFLLAHRLNIADRNAHFVLKEFIFSLERYFKQPQAFKRKSQIDFSYDTLQPKNIWLPFESDLNLLALVAEALENDKLDPSLKEPFFEEIKLLLDKFITRLVEWLDRVIDIKEYLASNGNEVKPFNSSSNELDAIILLHSLLKISQGILKKHFPPSLVFEVGFNRNPKDYVDMVKTKAGKGSDDYVCYDDLLKDLQQIYGIVVQEKQKAKNASQLSSSILVTGRFFQKTSNNTSVSVIDEDCDEALSPERGLGRS